LEKEQEEIGTFQATKELAAFFGKRIYAAGIILGAGYGVKALGQHEGREQGKTEAAEAYEQKEVEIAKSDVLFIVETIRAETASLRSDQNPDPGGRLLHLQGNLQQVAEITSTFDSFQEKSEAVRVLVDSSKMAQIVGGSERIKEHLEAVKPSERLETLGKLADGREKLPTMGKFTESLNQQQEPEFILRR